jgi:hypothetical protein
MQRRNIGKVILITSRVATAIAFQAKYKNFFHWFFFHGGSGDKMEE